MKNLITFLFICLATVFAAVNLSFDNVDTGAGTLSVVMENDEAVGGFQFDLTGVSITGTSGGSSASSGFTVSASSTTVLGFSFTGGTIPAGNETLIDVQFSGFADEICLAGVVMSSSAGTALDTTTGDCYTQTGGCTDVAACNYDSEATDDDGSCDYAEENYDCDGNCTTDTDCAGICGGDSFIDDCGFCVDGDTNPDDCLDANDGLPTEFSLSQNYPNPFNPSTNISFDVAESGNIDILVYDILGNYVNTLISGFYSQGKYTANWAGNDASGNAVASGIYIYQLIHDKVTITKKMTLLR